ncbi:uncharacterized protein MELLADRAFT_90017 [Melampsora larici-populina 98AG31]|uniref:FAD-binding PCMH-type domain-containing protein n=1 Tax=Melampsora larici-populina (strain 98AG31 / pathotype 3-4-7) TaxID=747676 RepID=F4RVF5_MELLP|nr:uncharacterized protein MELLADRAFT_90017 [Melampsora larici-populina 98AG31]EGG03680.1 hypothetical protein MELLADRAFT_90017 [Melampsora larici-populina 98AG31]
MLTSLFIVSCALSLVCYVEADTASLRLKFSELGIDAVFPGDSYYEEFAIPYNLRFTYLPAGIVFPNSTQAVADSIKVAVEENLPVSPRSGGHSFAAFGLGGDHGVLVVDVTLLNTISVDQSTGQAVIGTGNRLGDVAIGIYSQGRRALPHGSCPYVGIGGHAAFGGFGWASRMWGMTLDNIIGHEVVLANGTIVHASKDNNPDLFWALRGAGASFGIMTSIKFQTHPAPNELLNFAFRWDFTEDDSANALIEFQAFCQSNLPSELGMGVNFQRGSQPGRLKFGFVGAWFGDSKKFPTVIQKWLDVMPTPTTTLIEKRDWLTDVQGMARVTSQEALLSSNIDVTDQYDTFYAKSLTTSDSTPISNASIRAFSKHLASEGWISDTRWIARFELWGGQNSAITSVAKDATAFAQRSILLSMHFYASSKDYLPPFPDEGFSFIDEMVSALVGNGRAYGAYANLDDDRLASTEWQDLYFNDNYQRLSQIKSVYDPQNVFSYPQSIKGANSDWRSEEL